MHIGCLTFYAVKVLDIDVRVRGRHPGHVHPIEHHRHHVVAQNLPELLCDVVPAQRVLKRQIELNDFIEVKMWNEESNESIEQTMLRVMVLPCRSC